MLIIAFCHADHFAWAAPHDATFLVTLPITTTFLANIALSNSRPIAKLIRTSNPVWRIVAFDSVADIVR